MDGFPNILPSISQTLNFSALSKDAKIEYFNKFSGQNESSDFVKVIASVIFCAINIVGLPSALYAAYTTFSKCSRMTPTDYFILNLSMIDIISLTLGKI